MAIFLSSEAVVEQAAVRWRAGGLVAFPTETVYGLGANACDDRAVAAIYAAKGRPEFNPLIVHVASLEAAREHAVFSPLALALAQAFWPGPLTLILPRKPGCALSLLVSAGMDNVGLRVPSHPVARALLERAGLPIAAPSANRSGRISPTCADDVAAELGDRIEMIIDGGPCAVGVESTVVDVTGEVLVILRPGGITREEIEQVMSGEGRGAGEEDQKREGDGGMRSQQAEPALSPFGGKTVPRTVFLPTSPCDLQEQIAEAKIKNPKSPGMLESHYAPSLPVRLNVSQPRTSEALIAFGATVPEGAKKTLNLSLEGDFQEAAAHLFAALRALDSPEFSAIAVMPIPEEGLGVAINDRLRRAAAGR